MAGQEKNFVSISISKNIVERIEQIYGTAGYNTKTGLIQDCLRRAVERMESRIRNGTMPNGEKNNGSGGEEKQ